MLTSLTKKQESKLSSYKDKWIKMSFSCESLDLEKATKAVKQCYKVVHLDPPERILEADSPYSAILLILHRYDQISDRAKIPINQVWDQVWNQVSEQVWDQVRDQVFDPVKYQVWDQVMDQVMDQVWDQVWDQVNGQVRNQVNGQVRNQVNDQISNQVFDQVWDQVMDQGFNHIWLSCCDFLVNECNVIGRESLKPFIELAHHCGWWILGKQCAILQHRPLEIHLNNNVLHNETDLAVKYRDGWGVYALHGVTVPEWLVITKSENLNPRRLLKIKNAQVRAEFVRKVGIDRCFYKLGKVIDKQGDYELGMLELGDGRTRPYLKMRNPSVPELWHVEGVHPSCRSVTSALCWRNGTDEDPVQLT